MTIRYLNRTAGSIITATAPIFWEVGDVSWILNKVVVTQVDKGNMALTVYGPIRLAYVSQVVTIMYLVLLAESIAAGNMDKGDYFEGMPAGLRSIHFVFPFPAYQYIYIYIYITVHRTIILAVLLCGCEMLLR
jgi:hypothetical protein